MASDILELICWTFGDPSTHTFLVEIPKTATVAKLKNKIKEQKPAFQNIDVASLALWQVSIPGGASDEEFKQNLQRSLALEGKPPMFALATLSEYFSEAPQARHLHIVVQPRNGTTISTTSFNESNRVANVPRSPQTPVKQTRMEGIEMLHSHPDSPPRIAKKDIEPTMLTALEPFARYITYLAMGKLDGYFNSVRPEDLETDLQLAGLPQQPMLLLHDLGKCTDHKMTEGLFVHDTVHMFAVSGSGKTRCALEGLCHNWGFYISCRTQSYNGQNQANQAIGSCDFETATDIMKSMSKWDNGKGADNFKVAQCAFAMLLCARIFVLKHLLTKLPANTDATVARRRWVLAQVLPPSRPFFTDDIFVALVNSLRPAETADMLNLASTMLLETAEKVGDKIFPKTTPLFAVIDEAQVAAVYLDDSFRSITTGTDMRPVLHTFFEFLWKTKIVKGVILAGTSLSMKMVKTTLSSQVAKYMGSRQVPLISVELGRFTKDGTNHLDYIYKYLPLSDNSDSDRRLVERILYWFSGRYRFTATLIELLLYAQRGSQHRILSALVESLTQFTITDALDLEEKEPLLTRDTLDKIYSYGKVSGVERLFTQQGRELLIQSLLNVLMRWIIGSQGTLIPIEGDLHEIVALGIGHLEKVGANQTLDPKCHYPVYLCEPLSVLYLSSVFENQPGSWTKKHTWIANAFRTARNNASRGFVFEEVVLLVLMQMFGGQSRPLSDAFHCEQSWGSRNVTLVSLKRGSDDIFHSSPVSWTSGSSDRVGFKATSPTDILQFLNNPDGKCFVFPDNHMGPDLLCFLQDEESKELILLAVQAKISVTLNAHVWKSALDTVTPQFFYTAKSTSGRAQYVQSAYPGLSNDIMDVLDLALGPSEFKAAIDLDNYRQKLRSTTVQNQQLADIPQRKTPKFLRIIATRDDNQDRRLKVEWKGDVGVLRWNHVEQYLGSTADVVMTASESVA